MHLLQRKYRIDRACGVNLWGREKSPINKKPYRPGEHGTRRRRKVSNYAKQLMAKQKFKYYYGMKESQFRRFFKISMNKRGDTGTNLVRMLESRLDTVVYKLKWAATIFAAKQLVSHCHVLVNGKIVNISSYLVSPGDKVELSEKAKQMGVVRNSIESKEREVPAYIQAATDNLSGSLNKLPDTIEEVAYPAIMEMPMVIEMYSRLM